MQIEVQKTNVDKRYLEFVANYIAHYGKDPSCCNGWDAALKLGTQPTPNNIASAEIAECLTCNKRVFCSKSIEFNSDACGQLRTLAEPL